MATQYPPTSAAGSNGYSSSDRRESETTVGLLKQLTEDLSTLFRQELALATAELSRTVPTFLAGFASVAVSGAVLFSAFLVLLAAVVLALSNVMSPWLAALLVAVIVGLIGYGMLHAGLKKMKPSALKPNRTADSLRQDKDTLMRKT
jgi:hypothetical protein